MTKGPCCLDCGTRLSLEPWAPELCPRCSLQLALEQSPVDIDVGDDPEALPTRQFPNNETFSPGQILGSRFQIRSFLGRGGMGEVWRAYDLKLRVDVALKTLRAEFIEKERALQALRREVRSAREVVSPNVCRVFDLVELDGQELVSMEYVDGTTLVRVLQSRGPLGLQEAREIASQFLAGLEAIHQAGLIHRDLKPENLMITRSGRVVVMDFGIAKGLADRKTGTVSGTPAYMAPEQARGEAVDARADVFSAGVVLAEMIAPNGIRTTTAREAIWQGIHREPPELPDSPWTSVLIKAVARQADQRYPSAAALARALEEVTLQVEAAEDVQPYPGLASFTEEDAEYFFGRELEVEAMWKKLRRPHLLGLIGPSGAGKSSFLRAGLLPVMPEGWSVVLTTPGNRPFTNLASVLMHEVSEDKEVLQQFLRFEEPDAAISLFRSWRQQLEHGLVIVDQFEELFTLNTPEVQERFAALLGRLAIEADVHVLLSMRDDFLYPCQGYEPLRPMLSELTLLRPPTGAALRRALVQPALKCGYRFQDEALVEEMIAEVSEERGALPLLAFAAAQLWEHRDREKGLLTREAYEHIGGVGGALAQHAEATLEKIGTDRVPIVREMFRNLVTAQGTRAARDVEELLSVFENKDAANDVLRELINARLLTTYEFPADEDEESGRTRVEIIHESLLSAWPRLVRWRTQDQEGAQLRDELRQAAELWEQHDRSTDRLWTGTAVKEFQIWRERYSGGLTTTEDAFAQAMVQHAERRRRRKRFAVLSGFAVLLAVVAVVSTLWQRSVAETRRAEASKLLALGQLELERYPTAAVAYGLKSLEIADTYDARLFALRALQQGPTAIVMGTEWTGVGATANYVDVSPDGKWLALGGRGNAQLRGRDGGTTVALPGFSGDGFVGVKFTPRGDRLITFENTYEYGEVRYWSIPECVEVGSQRFFERGATGLEMKDRAFFTSTTVGEEEVLRAWPLDGGEPRIVGRMEALGAMVGSDIDREGKWLVWPKDRRVFLRSLEDWRRPARLLGEHTDRVVGVAFDPGGDHVAAIDASGEVRLWSTEPRTKGPERSLQAKELRRVLFDHGGTRLAAFGTSEMRPTLLWDMNGPLEAEPTVFRRLATTSTYVNQICFEKTGRWLLTAHIHDVAFWPLPQSHPIVLRGHNGAIFDVTFTPDGKHLVSASQDGTVRLWPLDARHHQILLRKDFTYPEIQVAPSGRFLLVSGRSSVFVVPLDGSAPRELTGFSSDTILKAVALSREGRYAAAAPTIGPAAEKVIRVWDLESGKCRVLGPAEDAGDGFVGAYSGLRFLPDGRLLSSTSSALRLWNLEDGTSATLRERKEGFIGDTNLALSRDGTQALYAELDMRQRGVAVPVLTDLLTGTSSALESHGRSVMEAAFDPTGTFAVTGDDAGVIRVGRLTGEEPHLLFGHEGAVAAVAVSPDGRWIASAGHDRTLRLWPMPDMDEPPFHTLPYEELLTRLRSVTNVRVVKDEAWSTGYRIDYAPFPGWEKVPEW